MTEKKPIGIIGAMAREVESLLSAMTEKREEPGAGMTFVSGLLRGVPCVVVKCGAGKVNAAACAQYLICRYHPRLVINIGVAGGIGQEIQVGDIVVATACIQHDYDTTAVGEPVSTLTMPGGEMVREFPCDVQVGKALLAEAEALYHGAHSGVIITGDLFLADSKRNRELGQAFGAKACEMEGGSIAHVCYLNGVPVAILRAISDNGDESGKMSFEEFSRMAAEKSEALLEAVVQKL